MPAQATDDAAHGSPPIRLEPELSSARVARRMLRDSLAAAGVSRTASWRDDAELAVHELVANAVLHAHTPIEVSIEPWPDHVRVEVRDFEPTLPSSRPYDTEATTGRGMGLVAALTDRCGARSLGQDGKIVWFVVGAETAPGAARWHVDGAEVPEGAQEREAVQVRLEAMPVRLWMAARQHHDAVLRELFLYLAERDPHEVDLSLSGRARGNVSRVVAQAATRLGVDQVSRWRAESVDLTVSLPRDLGPAYAALRDALDLGERLAVKGELLNRPGLPEIVEVREWVCQQIADQLAGATPSPWPGTADERYETAVTTPPGRSALPADVLGIRGSTRPVVAVDASNRIVAISPPLADLVGWPVDELVGRRIITVIPPEHREAHVAGFSRYLSSGDAHILGAQQRMPVLRRDGSRLDCRLLVEEVTGAGRDVLFVAWVEPVDPTDPVVDPAAEAEGPAA